MISVRKVRTLFLIGLFCSVCMVGLFSVFHEQIMYEFYGSELYRSLIHIEYTLWSKSHGGALR